MRRLWFVSIVLLTMIVASCGGDERPAVPRRYAYPRIETYSQDYKGVTGSGVTFDINSEAITETDSIAGDARWLSLFYPRYNATLYITVTRSTADQIDDVINNRKERMMLNNHSAATKIIGPFVSDRFTCTALYAPSGSSTPVQFLASDRDRWVVSGAAFFHDPAAVENADSVRPVVDALMDDVSRLMTTLKK